MRVCSGPGCLRVVPDDVRFCDECKPERQEHAEGIREHTPGTTDRQRYAFLYMGNRFQDGIRPRVLQRDPLCKRCGRFESVIVDHIVPAGEAIRQVQDSGRYPFDKHAGFFLLSNLQGLCRSCHALKTNKDKTHVGPWPDVLARDDAAPKLKRSF
jgi:5-methylcytosine-specific restriction endonuclease McrA